MKEKRFLNFNKPLVIGIFIFVLIVIFLSCYYVYLKFMTIPEIDLDELVTKTQNIDNSIKIENKSINFSDYNCEQNEYYFCIKKIEKVSNSKDLVLRFGKSINEGYEMGMAPEKTLYDIYYYILVDDEMLLKEKVNEVLGSDTTEYKYPINLTIIKGKYYVLDYKAQSNGFVKGCDNYKIKIIDSNNGIQLANVDRNCYNIISGTGDTNMGIADDSYMGVEVSENTIMYYDHVCPENVVKKYRLTINNGIVDKVVIDENVNATIEGRSC